jgi:hypothetical protein
MPALHDLVFVTYYRTAPTGQMGVFKRCTRLMAQLTGDFHVHLVNFGPLPEAEAHFESFRHRITIHEAPEEGLGEALHTLLERVQPRAVILGEAPLRGKMRLAHRVAAGLGLWQIGLENVFDRRWPDYGEREWPAIDRWLLIGLLENGFPERLTGKTLAVPPLVRFPPDFGTLERDRVTIIGYDVQSLRMGIRVLQLLPQDARADLFISPQGRGLVESGPNLHVFELPGDATIFDSIAHARFVVGKSGYNQIAESLLLGAPILARVRGGAMRDEWILPHMRPYVRILSSEDELSADLLPEARPDFSAVGREIPDPISFAADALTSLIAERDAPARPLRTGGRNEPAAAQDDFRALSAVHELGRVLASRSWGELQSLIAGAALWAFDRPLTGDELLDTAQRLLAGAVDVKLLLLHVWKREVWKSEVRKLESGEERSHLTLAAVLLWGEQGSWREHELPFDLHVELRAENGGFCFDSIVMTAPTPLD